MIADINILVNSHLIIHTITGPSSTIWFAFFVVWLLHFHAWSIPFASFRNFPSGGICIFSLFLVLSLIISTCFPCVIVWVFLIEIESFLEVFFEVGTQARTHIFELSECLGLRKLWIRDLSETKRTSAGSSMSTNSWIGICWIINNFTFISLILKVVE